VRPISRKTMAAALAISWVSMLGHNMYELPLGPLVVAVGLGVAYAVRPGSFLVALVGLAWGVLNLVVGGILSVLPLSFLPFAPEQSMSHHGAHVVYTLGQVPLVLVAYRAGRWAAASEDRPSTGATTR
jgi:hypothetical protein